MARKHTSRASLWVRILLVVPLPVIAALVWRAGQTPRWGLFESQALSGGPGPTATEETVRLPAQFPRWGLNLADTIQVYTPETLYEKIDGHDGAFLRFGFVSLAFATYADPAGTSLDIYLYRMDRRENALGIYAAERSDERENLAVLEAGYRSGGAVFFHRGPYYVQIIPAGPEVATAETVTEVLDSLCLMIPAPTAPQIGIAAFPTEGSVPNSDGYFPNKAFGTDFVGDVFTRQYSLGDAVVTAFRHHSDTAAAMFSRYQEFLRLSAQPEPAATIGGVEVQRYSSYGEKIWIFAVGNVFGGVTGQINEDSGKQLAGRLITAFGRK